MFGNFYFNLCTLRQVKFRVKITQQLRTMFVVTRRGFHTYKETVMKLDLRRENGVLGGIPAEPVISLPFISHGQTKY